MSREQRLADAFVALADTLVTDFDIVDLLNDLAGACVSLLEVSAAGLMLADAGGRLRVMASSSEQSLLVELMEIQNNEGPCLDCFRDSAPVLVADLTEQRGQWPRFADEAIDAGFGAIYALPMRLRQETIGALNLFHRHPRSMSADDLRIGQALADVATIGILQHRVAERGAEVTQELQTALNSRLMIEQAKGVLAERDQLSMDESFAVLRSHARRTHQKLSDLAQAVVRGELTSEGLRPPSRRRKR